MLACLLASYLLLAIYLLAFLCDNENPPPFAPRTLSPLDVDSTLLSLWMRARRCIVVRNHSPIRQARISPLQLTTKIAPPSLERPVSLGANTGTLDGPNAMALSLAAAWSKQAVVARVRVGCMRPTSYWTSSISGHSSCPGSQQHGWHCLHR
ncbi:hypothetical protein GGR51DRAFT_445947 [Nemania sp. FL0031]|nr:hypothetical protein GGR51DRAFT_445947 [Nemania sp. FL0031]